MVEQRSGGSPGITFSSGPLAGQTIALSQPRLTVGSAPTTDILIDHPAIAPEHAVLMQVDSGAWVIAPACPACPLSFNGRAVEHAPLSDHDTVGLGPVQFQFLSAVPASAASSASGPAGVSFKSAGRGGPSSPRQGTWAERPAIVSIGRAPGNAIRLEHPSISWHHAYLTRDLQSGRATLTDRGSTSGTFVNGQRLRKREQVHLLAGDEIDLGPYRLLFRGGELIQQDARPGIRVDAYHLHKAAVVSRWREWLRLSRPKALLDDISLSIPPHTFVVLVGGSGVGKSMLLDALSGLRPAHQGTVLYNGNDAYRHREAFSTLLGYVPQDDILHHNLTVERALYYTAKLRLPADSTRAEIRARIDDVLETMELTASRKLRISKLSGGQRKRASIALELLAQPSLFFLDEPTSGLDPGLDSQIMGLLRWLADRGHTIILTTHTLSDIDPCDYVCFLAPGGRMDYYGPPEQAKRFFGTTNFADIYNALEPTEAHPSAPAEWAERFHESLDYQIYVAQPLQYTAALSQQARPQRATALPPPRRGHPVKQFVLLVRRYAELLRNDTINLLILLLQAPIIAVILLGLTRANIFAQHTYFDEGDVQTPLFVMVVAAIWFGTLNAAREIVKEAPVYRRERSFNLGLIPYVLSKVFVLGLLCLLQSFALLYIVGLKSGYPSSGILLPPFAEMYLSLALTSLGGLTMGLLVSSLAPNTDRAMSIIPLLLVAQIIFAGNIFKLSGGAAWISYFMLARWGMVALGSTENLHAGPTLTASDFYGHDSSHLLTAWLALVGLTLFFLALTFFFQKRKDVRV